MRGRWPNTPVSPPGAAPDLQRCKLERPWWPASPFSFALGDPQLRRAPLSGLADLGILVDEVPPGGDGDQREDGPVHCVETKETVAPPPPPRPPPPTGHATHTPT